MSISLYGYLLLAFIVIGYAGSFGSFTVKLREEPTALAWMCITIGLMFLLFCGLFMYLWSFDRGLLIAIGACGFVVLMITMFSVRPLLRVAHV